MSLIIIDCTSTQLVFAPLYLLGVMSFFFVQHNRRVRLLPTAVRIQVDHIAVYSYRYVATLATPFIVLFWLLMSSFRGFEGFFFLSQMYVTAWHIKWFFFSFFFSLAANTVFSWAPIATTLPYIFEMALSLVWLFWSVWWALCVSNLIIFIFFLEILGLLLLTALLYMFVTGRHSGTIAVNHKLFNTSYGAKFFFIQAFIFFLWSSVISMLFLFWSSLYLAAAACTLELTLVELFYEFGLATGGWVVGGYWLIGVCFFFFIAVLLKTAIVPLQFWLVAFYKHLPLYALFAYLAFYYLYFVIVITTLFFGYLYPLTSLWYWYSLIIFGMTILYAAPSLVEATTIRGFFAYSSAINLFMLFIFMLSTFSGVGIFPGV